MMPNRSLLIMKRQLKKASVLGFILLYSEVEALHHFLPFLFTSSQFFPCMNETPNKEYDQNWDQENGKEQRVPLRAIFKLRIPDIQ